MKRLRLLSVLFLTLSVSGCTLESRIDRSPDMVTLAVGETAPSPRASISGYRTPRQTVRFDSWTSEDPNIASINPDTGVITGVAPGGTTVLGSGVAILPGEDYSGVFDFAVTVVSP